MWPSSQSIADFYKTDLGQITLTSLTQAVLKHAPLTPEQEPSTKIILGIGQSAPLLQALSEHNAFDNSSTKELDFLSLSLNSLGAYSWPSEPLAQQKDKAGQHKAKLSLSAVAQGRALPFSDNSVDFIVMMHALEFSTSAPELMQEAQRILSDQGRLVLIVSNRMGLWSRSERSPFGYGSPYSFQQTYSLLQPLTQMKIKSVTGALYFPPHKTSYRMMLSKYIEHWNLSWLRQALFMMAGVNILVIQKSSTGAKKPLNLLRKQFSLAQFPLWYRPAIKPRLNSLPDGSVSQRNSAPKEIHPVKDEIASKKP